MCETERSGLVVECLTRKPRGRGFEPHRRHCVVVLERDTFILASAGSTKEAPPCLTKRLLMRRKESNQTNKSKYEVKIQEV